MSSKPHNLLALQEMIDVARSTGVSLQVSHAVVFFRVTWPTVDRYLGMIEEARRQGVDVMMDAIPYTALNGSVSTLLPLWFIARLPQGYKSRWARMRVNVEYNPLVFRRSGYDVKKQVRLMDAGVQGWEDLSGLTIGEIARKWGVSTMDAALRLCEASDGRAAVLCQAAAGEPGNEKHLETILSHSSLSLWYRRADPQQGLSEPSSLRDVSQGIGALCQRKEAVQCRRCHQENDLRQR